MNERVTMCVAFVKTSSPVEVLHHADRIPHYSRAGLSSTSERTPRYK